MTGSRFVAGQQIGSYRLIKYLGAGGFGEVWLAERTAGYIAQRVALKLPFDPDEDLVRQEAQTWIHASGHPNILPVLDADKDSNGQIYIASEFADGGTLTDWLNANGGKAPSLESAVRMMTHILSGLEYLHAIQPRPIIHRDLKPDNILLQGGVPRITDFGIARVLRSTNVTKMTSGTPAYMATEVFARGDYGVASDLWAAGVIFYRMLTGSLPFPQSDLPSLMHAIVMGTAATPPASLPPTIQPIFTTVFQKDPGKRYPSAEAMRKDIEALLRSPEPTLQKPTDNLPSTASNSLPTVNTLPTVPSPIPSPTNTSRRGFLWGIPVIVAVACSLYALRRTTKVNPIDGAEMAWIPEGRFQMGYGYGHTVPLSGYWIYTTPVTVAQFRKYDDANGHKYDWNHYGPIWGWIDDHPMVCVSWEAASAYAKWAGVSLPTEAQWEKAARGGLAGKEYPWGDGWDASKCANSVRPNILYSTKPIKSYAPNGYGLYDMPGNVWEWCSDWSDYGDYSKTPAASQQDPTGPESNPFEGEGYRVLRGGSWVADAQNRFTCISNSGENPKYEADSWGFRCITPRLSGHG